uniref:Uncharacterized protein n=1 Tax=uncultured marine virus TaxID=186617 RepID=A0A0F7L4Z2_9VIRU|nr:hypothetical protein [uncultured marine virus]
MASGDARPVPQKAVAYRVTFPVFDNDGDLVTGAASLDSEVSKDGGAFADCTNEATEIASSSGIYFLDLTAAELNADTVCIIVKTTSTDAKTTPIILYPEEAGDIRVDVTQLSGDSTAANNAELFFDGTGYAAANSTIGTCTTNTDMRGTDSAATAAALATVDGIVDAILADTGTDGVVLSTAYLNKIADHVLRRSWESAADSSDGDAKAFRSLLGAVAKLVNKIAVAGATLSIYEEDDSTVIGQQALSSDSTADPITAADTV